MNKQRPKLQHTRLGKSPLSNAELSWKLASGDGSPEDLSLAKARALKDPSFQELLLDEIAFESLVALAGEESASAKPTTWTCEEVRLHTDAWRAHELDACSSAAVTAHVSACSPCQRTLSSRAMGVPGANRFGAWKILAASAVIVIGAFWGGRFFLTTETPSGSMVSTLAAGNDLGGQTTKAKIQEEDPNSHLKKHPLLTAYRRPSHIVWPNLPKEILREAIEGFWDPSTSLSKEFLARRAARSTLGDEWNQEVEAAISSDLILAQLGHEVGLDKLQGENRNLTYFLLAAALHPNIGDPAVIRALNEVMKRCDDKPAVMKLVLGFGLQTDNESLFNAGLYAAWILRKSTLSPEFRHAFYPWALSKAIDKRWYAQVAEILQREMEGLFVSPLPIRNLILDSPNPEFWKARARLARNMLREAPTSIETLTRLHDVEKTLTADYDRVELLVVMAKETGDESIIRVIKNIADSNLSERARFIVAKYLRHVARRKK